MRRPTFDISGHRPRFFFLTHRLQKFMKNSTSYLSVFTAFLVSLGSIHDAGAHCQIPCGIYDDPARFVALMEHVTTIEKSMLQISKLSSGANSNQIVRWTNNKEHHADALAHIVTYYFMAQRIKPAPEGDSAAAAAYAKHLSLLHHMLVHAMKCKQTIDPEHCAKLEGLITEFQASYLGK